MADTLPDLEEKPFPIFHISPLSLLELASRKIALYVWLEKYREYGKMENNLRISDSHLQHDELQLHFFYDVPQQIRNIIDSSMDPITRELQWWHDILISACSVPVNDQIYSRFDLVVFAGDGSLHLRDTIANIFLDESLSNEKKFEIACVHCVKEKVDLYWPLVKDASRFNGNYFRLNYMLHYWINKKGGNAHQATLGQIRTKEQIILRCCKKRWRLAVEYFLKSRDQSWDLNKLLTKIDGNVDNEVLRALVYVLPLLDATLQRQIFDSKSLLFFHGFFNDPELIKYAFQMWLYIKDSLTIELLYDHFISPCVQYRLFDRDNRQKYTREKAFAEIWSDFPRDWKRHTLTFHFTDILKQLNRYDVEFTPKFYRDIVLLLAMLSDVGVDSRKSFWNENWSKWFEKVPPAQLEELITLCLVDTEAIDNFKQGFHQTDKFRGYCNILMSDGYYKQINEFVNTLYPNQDTAINIKKRLLEKHTEIIFIQERRKFWQKHCEYIDQVFSNPNQADDFKCGLFLSVNIWDPQCSINDDDFDEVCDLSRYFIPSSKSEKMIAKILEVLRKRVVEGRLYPFDESQWEKFLRCCIPHKQRVVDFKKSLPIDRIFERALSKCLCTVLTIQSLLSFLMWYFNSMHELKNFLRGRIRYYETMRRSIVESIFEKDKKLVIRLMKMEFVMIYQTG